MGDVPKNLEEVASKLWGMTQRVGMQIAAKPQEQRTKAFTVAERSLRDMAKQMGIADGQMDGFIELQMKAIRQMVTQIDVGGTPEGGNA